MTGKNVLRAALMLGLLALAGAVASRAECLPTSGTFEGYYHKDRWGLARFKFYIVHPDLHARLAPFEGKRIRVEVTRAEQPFNPGPAVLLAVGKVTPLARGPLEVRARTIPEAPGPSEPFQLVLEVRNNGKQELHAAPGSVGAGIVSKAKVPDAEKPSYFIKGYTRGQLARGSAGGVGQIFQSLVTTWQRERGNLAYMSARVAVAPGDFFPLAIPFEKGLPGGEYEIELAAGGQLPKPPKDFRVRRWVKLDVPGKKKTDRKPPPGLRVLARSVKTLEEGYELSITLAPDGEGKRRVPGYRSAKDGVWSGRLLAFDKEGARVPLEAERVQNIAHPELWRMVEVPPEGMTLRAKFRRRSRFSAAVISRLRLQVLTDRGLESFALAEDFKDAHAITPPPFGDEVGGVELRARPARATFKPGERLRFHLQAVNTSGKPVVWWWPSSQLGGPVRVIIDGKVAKLPRRKAEYIGGWAAKWTCPQPEEWTVELPAEVQPKAGKHTFQYIISSRRGSYKNSVGQRVPCLRGKLASNVAGFEVR